MLIKKLLSGTDAPINNKLEKTPVNLIVIGFDMQSFEFNMLFEECFPVDSKIYFINQELPIMPILPVEEGKEKKDRRKKFLKMFEGENFIEVKKIAKNHDKNININTPLDNVVETLWQNIINLFKEEYLPRSISRHKLISSLFKEHELITEANPIEYLKDRTWIELTLSIAKYKGFVSFNQLVNDRFGKYFFLYRQKIEEKIIENPDKIDNIKIFPRTISHFCQEIGLSPLGYSSKAFMLGTNANSLTVDITAFKKQIPEIFQRILGKLNEDTRARLNNVENLYIETLLDIFDKEDSEVSPKYDNSYKSIFLNPKLIKTFLSLNYQTRFLFDQPDWTALLVVAETGEWMINKIKEFPNKKVILVIADNAKAEDLKSKIPDVEIHYLKWWLHNQHMTIFVRGEKPNYEPLRAIYFVRRHRSTHLHPVILTDKDDCKLLIETFAAYCKKSKNIEDYIKKKLPTEVKPIDIKTFFQEYFNSLV